MMWLGLIYGLYYQHVPQNVGDYATVAAFDKLQEFGDATREDELTVSKAIESILPIYGALTSKSCVTNFFNFNAI